MKKIVVGYDATPEAERALERAAEIGKALDAEIVVTSVARVLHGWGKGMGGPDPVDPPELHQAELRRAKKRLEELGVEPETVDAVGEPWKKIVELADTGEADLIVVGSRGAGPIERFFVGSVSNDVTHHARCDVLVVR